MQDIRFGVWCVLLSGFLFGIPERYIALNADGWISAPDFIQLFTALFFMVLVCFLCPIGDVE